MENRYRLPSNSFVPIVGLAFPGPLLTFGQTRVHLCVVGILAEKIIHGFLQFLGRSDRVLFVGFNKDEFATRSPETEEERDSPNVGFTKTARRLQGLRRELRRVEAQVNLPGKLFGSVLQRH